MFRTPPLLAIALLPVLLSATGCVEPGAAGTAATASASFGTCGVGGDLLSRETLAPAAIPGLAALDRTQIIEAVQESTGPGVTTIEAAFAAVDEHLINRLVLHDPITRQFYLEIEFGAGDNSYGAIFFWGTAVKATAIHDGDQVNCGPAVFNDDPGDLAPACTGLLDYANTAPFSALDAYLPSNVAQAIVSARAAAPFGSIASLVAVDGVAEFRLQQLLAAARAASLVGPTCSGVHDQIGISTSEADALVALVDQASASELHGVLGFLINETVVDRLIAGRPFATAGAIAEVSGIGTASFRALRNAATFRGPFEQLVDAINAIDRPDAQIRFDTHFDWVPLVTDATGFSEMDCFGVASSLVPAGATLRTTPAGGNELLENAGEGVALASAFDALALDPTPGLTDLELRTTGHSFLGCYLTYHPDPWVYDRQSFFVDLHTGFSLMITSHDVE